MLHYSVTRLRYDLTCIVEGSPDLKSWETLDTNPDHIGETVTVETSREAGCRFLRLRVISSSSTPKSR